MDPVSAIGLAASVIGIAATAGHLANKVFTRIQEFKNKSDSVPEVFETIYANLPLLLADLKKFNNEIKTGKQSAEVLTASKNLVGRLQSLLTRLEDKLKILIPSDQDSQMVRLRKAWESICFETEAGRIWEQICECRNSLTFNRVVAWGSTEAKPQWVPSILEIPQGRQVEFVGRQQILSDIADLLSTGDGRVPPTVILRGMGGQGKTQLALRFCIENWDRTGKNNEQSKKYHAIFWVDATSETATRRSFLRIYELVKTSDITLNNEDAQIQYAKQALQGWTFPWLVVFDDYDKPSAFQSIRDYMPINQEGAVLVTSRHEDSAYVGKVLDVPALSQDEATELLLKQIRDKDDTRSTEAVKLAKEIVVKLGCHALAVHQAGCFINKNCMLSGFLSRYDTERAKVMSWTPAIWPYVKPVPEDDQHQIAFSVFTTFQLAFDALPYDGNTVGKVRRFLEICSYLAINRISDTLFLASMSDDIPALDLFRKPDRTWNQAKFQTIIVGLREYGLVLPGIPARRNFAIHPLISDWLKIKDDGSEEALKAMQLEDGMLAARVVRNCLEALVQDLPHRYLDLSLDIRQEILPHVFACEEVVCQSSDANDAFKVHSICEAFAEFFDSCGINDSAQRIQEVAVKTLKSSPDPDSGKLTTSICLLARIYHHKGMSAEAEQLLRERLSAVEDSFAKGDPRTLALAELLTSTLSYQCKFDEAEKYAARVLDIRGKRRPDDKRELLKCRGARAWIWQHNQKIKEAEEEGKKILDARFEGFGPDDLDTLSSNNAQGCIFLEQGKLQDAENLLQRAADGRRVRLGAIHPSTLNALTNLSMVFASQGRWKEAISKSKEILEAREAQLGGSHICTLASVANLLDVVKDAPKDLFPQDKAACLQTRLDGAAKQGLWEWTPPRGSNPALGPNRAAMSGKRQFEHWKLMRHMSSIWRPSSPNKAQNQQPRRFRSQHHQRH